MDDDVTFRVRQPEETVYMNYARLDPEMTRDEYDQIIRNGDAVVTWDEPNKAWMEVEYHNLDIDGEGMESPLILQTTFEGEMSYLLQIAVDNPKFGLLADIKFNGYI